MAMNRQFVCARAGALSSCVTVLLAACGGGGSGNGNPQPPPDTTPPNTTISAAPAALTNSNSASLAFTATEAGTTFESRLDGAAFAAATSPQALAALAEGSHTFEVRARDAAGNVDATPATATWVVDTVPPETQLTATPAATALTEPHVFSASAAGEANATFEISVDNGAFTATSLPVSLTSLANGPHNVRVRAHDAAGNVDATPAQFDWNVSIAPVTTTPETTISAQPPAIANTATASFSFDATPVGATFEYRVDGGAYIAAASPVQLSGLAEGLHTFDVRARLGGVVDATPASVTWRVDMTSPTGAIVFPTPVSYSDGNTLTVRGTANDAVGLQSVMVNGVAATSTTNFNTWSAVIGLAPGTNSVTVGVTDSAGNTNTNAASAVVTNRGPPLLQAGGTDYDPATDSIIIADVESNTVVGFYLAINGSRTISHSSQAPDPDDTIISDLVVDAPNNRALAVDWGADAIVAINLTLGTRTTLSSGNGTGPTSLTIGNGIAYDPANNRVFVTVMQTPSITHAIIAVDLATSDRAVVSSGTVGAGPAFTNAGAIVYDAANSRLLVSATVGGNTGILQVNPTNGDRVLFSQSPGTGAGPAIPFPSGFHLDAANGRLYVSDASVNSALFRIDLVTGDRTLIGAPGTGSGPALSLAGGLAFKTATGQLFAPQRTGDVLAVNTTTLARTVAWNSRVGSGVDMDRPFTVRAEQLSGTVTSLLFAEPEGQRLMRLNLATGAVSVVSGGEVGTGPALSRFIDFVIDPRPPVNGTAVLGLLSSPGNSLVSIDLATGNRTVHANLTPATQLRSLALDSTGNRVLFTNIDFSTNTSGLYAIDLTTLAISPISSASVGSGATFNGPANFLLDPEVNPTRALLVDLNPSAFIQVNLANGVRSPFIGINGTPPLTLIGPIYFDRVNSQIYGLNLFPQNLWVSGIAAGGGETSRVLLSGVSVANGTVRGTGPAVDFGSGLFVDTLRGVAFAGESTMGAIMAIDVVSGDRVIIAR